MLPSVYFRSLVDLENKSCVRVPLVITLPECRELNHCCCDGLKKPFKCFVSSFTRTTFARHLEGGLCKVRTGWWRMADGGWRMADRKMRMIKCGWKKADDKMPMIKRGRKNADDKMGIKNCQ